MIVLYQLFLTDRFFFLNFRVRKHFSPIKSYIHVKLLACEEIFYLSSALKCVNYTFPKAESYSRQVCILINTCWDKNRNVRKYEQVSLRIACVPILLLFIKIFISLMNYKTSSLLSKQRMTGAFSLHLSPLGLVSLTSLKINFVNFPLKFH